MQYRDLRDFIDKLEKAGELKDPAGSGSLPGNDGNLRSHP